MDTPICDFARRYRESQTLRLHMPGHKGLGPLGIEALDLTEVEGADSLYEANGIIQESEKHASSLFGCPTFYSTEGSSLCIRAMLYLVAMHAKKLGKQPMILAGRNAHKAFISAAALLDLDVQWLYPARQDSYLSCQIETEALEKVLENENEAPVAVYLTSPDYLGNVLDVGHIAQVCRKHGVLLLVDNAHGAYLKFLPESLHPIDLGADLCCDSAHKTLPVLTGGAYLHLSPTLPGIFAEQAKSALALFGSTSPSYLILQSLDACNRYLSDDYKDRLWDFIGKADGCQRSLIAHGYRLLGNEPLKITIDAKAFGYTGHALAALLHKKNIVCEFSDPDFLVLMLTPEVGAEGLKALQKALLSIPSQKPSIDKCPAFHAPEKVMSIREASLSPSETLPISQCNGRILASASVGCPPAVPILVCGERINEGTLKCFSYYGIENCTVIIV